MRAHGARGLLRGRRSEVSPRLPRGASRALAPARAHAAGCAAAMARAGGAWQGAGRFRAGGAGCRARWDACWRTPKRGWSLEALPTSGRRLRAGSDADVTDVSAVTAVTLRVGTSIGVHETLRVVPFFRRWLYTFDLVTRIIKSPFTLCSQSTESSSLPPISPQPTTLGGRCRAPKLLNQPHPSPAQASRATRHVPAHGPEQHPPARACCRGGAGTGRSVRRCLYSAV